MNTTEGIYNSHYAVNNAIDALNGDDGLNVSTKAIMLRFMIHIVGDIHQPLHSIELFNKTYVNGDYGGNLEYITTYISKIKTKLHMYFDSGAELL